MRGGAVTAALTYQVIERNNLREDGIRCALQQYATLYTHPIIGMVISSAGDLITRLDIIIRESGVVVSLGERGVVVGRL